MAISRDDTLLTPEMIETYTAAGYWSDATLADVFRANAREIPDKVAYVDARSEVTWGELWRISGEVASGLAHRGVKRGDVVAVQLPNRIEFVHVLAAVVRLGAVFCQFPPDYRAREIEFILRFSEAHTVVVPDRFRDFDYVKMVDGIRDRLPQLVNTVAVNIAESGSSVDSEGWVTLGQLRRDPDPADPAPDRPSDANDVMRIAFTSGTTGEPKAVMHMANTTLFYLQHGNRIFGIGDDATILLLLPVGLNVGFSAIVQTAIAGACAVLMERFSPVGLLDLVERHAVTTFLTAPTALLAIVNDDTLGERDLSSLRLVGTGGSSTPVNVLSEANERLGCPVIDTYGMLETGLTSNTDPDEPYEDWVGTVGRSYPWMQVRILDGDDQDVAVGVEGEIVKTGPTICVGYYRNPAKNKESWTADGWFRSGDRGYLDENGRLTISGRSKDVIIHAGANIWPRELEEILSKHPAVADVAVVGIHDDYFGENACACIIPRPGTTVTLDDVIGLHEKRRRQIQAPPAPRTIRLLPIGTNRQSPQTRPHRRGRDPPHRGTLHRDNSISTVSSTPSDVISGNSSREVLRVSAPPSRLIDFHSHWGTAQGWKGSPFDTPEAREAVRDYFKWDMSFVSEEEQAAQFRRANAKVMLDLAYTRKMDVGAVREQHDYAFGYARTQPDVVLGNWISIDPTRPGHVKEFERCLSDGPGLVGLGLHPFSAAGQPDEPGWEACLNLCIEANRPVLMLVGMSANGAGTRGGMGLELESCHPRYVDRIAARYPDLNVIVARVGWPWQSETIAIALHKANVWMELHGWSPRYYPEELKREIGKRLRKKVFFAADYPMLSHERLLGEWREQGFAPDVLDDVFHRNAETFLTSIGVDC